MKLGDKLPELHGGHYGVAEQCTGLKDKNGRLIYEGDMVQYKQCGELRQNIICFSEDFNCFTIGIGWGSSTKRHALRIPRGCEIIGNIHENQELLK